MKWGIFVHLTWLENELWASHLFWKWWAIICVHFEIVWLWWNSLYFNLSNICMLLSFSTNNIWVCMIKLLEKWKLLDNVTTKCLMFLWLHFRIGSEAPGIQNKKRNIPHCCSRESISVLLGRFSPSLKLYNFSQFVTLSSQSSDFTEVPEAKKLSTQSQSLTVGGWAIIWRGLFFTSCHKWVLNRGRACGRVKPIPNM